MEGAINKLKTGLAEIKRDVLITPHTIKITLTVLLVLTIVLIVAGVMCMHKQATRNLDYLYGYWVADEAFCEKAQIGGMLLFIGGSSVSHHTKDKYKRTCNLVILDEDGEVSFTNVFIMKLSGLPIARCYTMNLNLLATDKMAEVPPWHGKLKIKVDVDRGTLQIMSNTTEFGRFTKNHAISNVAMRLDRDGYEEIDDVGEIEDELVEIADTTPAPQ